MSAHAMSAEPAKTCQILILSEDFPAYEQAVSICRRILSQFSNELDFTFNCWNFTELADAQCARSATRCAANADIVLISMHGVELPANLDQWLGFFPEQKSRADGALVLVPNGQTGEPEMIHKLLSRLRLAAEQMGKDFVSLLPAVTAPADVDFMADNLPLAAIRRRSWASRNYDHWGLNE